MLKSLIISGLQIIATGNQSDDRQLQYFLDQIEQQHAITQCAQKSQYVPSKTPIKPKNSNAHLNDPLYRQYNKQILIQISSYKAPNKEEYAKMGFVEKTTADCMAKANKAFIELLKGANLEINKARPENMQRLFDLMEKNPDIQRCITLMVKSLMSKGYYEKYKKCYNETKTKQCEEELANIILETARSFAKEDPRNMFKKTFTMDIAGPAVAYAGHPQNSERNFN